MLRFLHLAVLVCTVAFCNQPEARADEKADAEKLLKATEEKLAKAKSLECVFQGKIDADKKIAFEGTLFVVEGDKYRLEMSGEEPDGKKRQMLLVCDGKKLVAVEDDKRQPETDAPKGQSQRILGAMGRGGVFLPTLGVRSGPGGGTDEKIEDLLKVSDFKLGKKEKVGDAETQAIEYTLTLKGEKESPTCTLWIDLKTHLPVKRTLTLAKENMTFTITETYSKINLDGKIDAAKFELPK